VDENFRQVVHPAIPDPHILKAVSETAEVLLYAKRDPGIVFNHFIHPVSKMESPVVGRNKGLFTRQEISVEINRITHFTRDLRS
jgi:hypothetical protein